MQPAKKLLCLPLLLLALLRASLYFDLHLLLLLLFISTTFRNCLPCLRFARRHLGGVLEYWYS